MNIARKNAIKGLAQFSTEQLHAAYQNIKAKNPPEEHYRRSALAILEEIEARGRAVDRFVARLKATPIREVVNHDN